MKENVSCLQLLSGCLGTGYICEKPNVTPDLKARTEGGMAIPLSSKIGLLVGQSASSATWHLSSSAPRRSGLAWPPLEHSWACFLSWAYSAHLAQELWGCVPLSPLVVVVGGSQTCLPCCHPWLPDLLPVQAAPVMVHPDTEVANQHKNLWN